MKDYKYRLVIPILVITILVISAWSNETFAKESSITVNAQNDTDFCMEVSELSGNATMDENSATVSDRLLIVCNEEMDFSGYNGVARIVSNDYGLYVIQFDSAQNAEKAKAALQRQESVESVEYDKKIQQELYEAKTVHSNIRSNHLSWGVPCIGADTYKEYINSISHGQLTLAVVDSGVDINHSFLSGRIIEGYDFVRNDNEPDDEEGHGTHVSGIIADCTQGINDIKIMPIKVLDEDGGGMISDIANGLLYAADNGASIINTSLGGEHSGYLDAAAKRVINRGVILVTASGNEARDIDRIRACPAHISEAITVGVIDEYLHVMQYSNYGEKLDLVAPGENINSSSLHNSFETISGTSMAAPHVSACIALLQLAYDESSYDEIYSLLKRSCDTRKDITRYGMGILNLNNLISDINSQDIHLQKKKYEYTGKPIKVRVNISRNGENLFEKEDFVLTYKDNKKIGHAKVKIKGVGSYRGESTVTFLITPKKGMITAIRPAKNSADIHWKKVDHADGYQIQYSTSKKFISSKKKTIRSEKINNTKINGLKSQKKYYIRIRTYKSVDGKKIYSEWSKAKDTTTK